MKIGFLVGDIANISGGSNVIIEYAARLQARGHEVQLLTASPVEFKQPLWHPLLASLTVRTVDEAVGTPFDFAFATWWLTFFDLWKVQSRVYGYLNQSLESRFHAERIHKQLNRATYSLPLLFVTEARWLREFITQLRPDARVIYVQNGLSRENFPCVDHVPEHSGTLRVLVEGRWGVGFKGVPETFAVLDEARRRVPFEVGWLTSTAGDATPSVGGVPVRVHARVPIHQVQEVLRGYDVMVKLSRVEGMFGPPLEMFSQGGTAITYTVTGADEYMVHGHNGLVVEPYDRRQIVHYLELLVRHPEYLAHLRRNALRTAQAFPDWDLSSDALATALEQLHAEGYDNAHLRPALEGMAALRGHWLDTHWRSGVADAGTGERVLLERYRRLKSSRPVRAAMALVPPGLRRSLRAGLTRVLSS